MGGGHVELLSGPTVYSLYYVTDKDLPTIAFTEALVSKVKQCWIVVHNVLITFLDLTIGASHLKSESCLYFV